MKYKLFEKIITNLSVPVENVIIQSIKFKTSLGDWVNVTAFDDIKCSITFEKNCLYFYCVKLHSRYTGECMIVILQILNDVQIINNI